MADRVVQPYHGSDGMAGQSMHPNQSAWMSHWMQTSCKSAPRAFNRLSLHYESKEDGHDAQRHPLRSEPGIVSDISESAKGFRGITEARSVKIMNESMTTSSNNLRKERLDCKPFPMFNLCRNRETILGPKNDQPTICHRQVLRSQIDHNSGYNTIAFGTSENRLPSVLALAPPETETSPRCDFQPKCISQNLELPVKSHKFIEKNSLAVSTSFLDDFMGSTSNIMSHGFNSKKTPIQSFMCRQERVNQLNSVLASKEPFTTLTHLEHEHCNYHSYSALLVCEKKMDNHLKSKTTGTSLLRQSDGALLLHDPSTSNSQLPYLLGEKCQKMQNHSGIGFFPSRSSPPEVIKSEKLYHGCYSLEKMPCSVHDVETMRLCTTVDSVEGISGCPPKFSQTTHRLFITEKTDVNLSEGGQMFREPSVSTKFKGNTFSGLLSLSPNFCFQGQQGLKLQPLDSSTDSKGNDNIGHTKTSAVDLKNESSAETDTMDMDAFQEKNHLSGLALSLPNKDIMGGQNLQSSQATIASSREEVGGRLPNTELPDINEEPPALPAVASSMDDGEPSTSRTQSLNVEHLLSHAEQPTNSKSSPCSGGPLGLDPSSRWVKRLKLSTSNSFAHGTKSSKMEEASSHEKANKFNKIMKCSTTGTEPTLGIRHGKEHMALDQTAVLLREGKSSSMDSLKKGRDIKLSCSWIQRWCHNRAVSPQKKPEAVVVCEPQSSKFDEFQKKQFPSIAAMSLMGKAMSGFHPCEFKKRGSFVVWNTKGF